MLDFSIGLIDSQKCAGLESTVDNRLQQIIEQWEFLVQKSSDKSLKLKEASRQQTFNAGVKDVEFWLGEVSPIGSFLVSSHQISRLKINWLMMMLDEI